MELIDPAHVARDSKLIRQAILKGWDIPDRLLSSLPETMGQIAESVEEKAQDRIAAARVLVAMKSANEKTLRPRRRGRNQSAAMALGAGIGVGIGIGAVDGNGGMSIDERKRELAVRIAGLIGVSNVARGDGGA
jgi:hypothetical protein